MFFNIFLVIFQKSLICTIEFINFIQNEVIRAVDDFSGVFFVVILSGSFRKLFRAQTRAYFTR